MWKWRELKRGEEEINEIIGRAGGQGSEVGPYTGERIDHANTHMHTLKLQYVQYTQSEAFAHACSPFRIHLEDMCMCVAAVYVSLLCV